LLAKLTDRFGDTPNVLLLYLADRSLLFRLRA